ncbi:class D sortase [Clostridium swellfunianum]|uniref:class D sortase n=1 Tax=Clostridium swellfunianum TaxID=1367462 RepID=UPI00202E5AAE|nr:class D sortase [Clostridium swellfunianum]MCM0647787.1 class D sortase [Clostridium swellfunianum]
MKRRIIGIIFIFMGLSIIGSALFMRYSANRQQQAMLEAFEKTIQKVDEDLGNENAQSSEIEASPNAKPPSEDVNAAIGIIKIPKIDLKVAVGEGIDNNTLKYAVGHFEGTAMPGEKGNFAVAGHRSYTYSEYFNRLDELNIGDDITVKTKKGEFTYRVYEKKVVEPTEVSVLDKTKDATITLVTCTPIRVATHRLIIKGKLQ